MNSIEFDGRTASVCYEFTVPECKLQRGDNTSLEARAASADSSAQTDREQSEQSRDERPYSLSEEPTSTGDFAVQINQKNWVAMTIKTNSKIMARLQFATINHE